MEWRLFGSDCGIMRPAMTIKPSIMHSNHSTHFHYYTSQFMHSKTGVSGIPKLNEWMNEWRNIWGLFISLVPFTTIYGNPLHLAHYYISLIPHPIDHINFFDSLSPNNISIDSFMSDFFVRSQSIMAWETMCEAHISHIICTESEENIGIIMELRNNTNWYMLKSIPSVSTLKNQNCYDMN